MGRGKRQSKNHLSLLGGLSASERLTLQTYETQALNWAGGAATPDFWEPELKEFSGLCPQGKIFDVGSGSGRDATLLSNHGYQVTGVDISSSFLELARERSPRANFIEGSVYALPAEDQSFDGVWAAAVLLHIPKKKISQALGEIKRVLRPDGASFISIKKGQGEKMLTDRLGERFYAFWQPNEFIKVLNKAGFKVISWQERPEKNECWLCFYVQPE